MEVERVGRSVARNDAGRQERAGPEGFASRPKEFELFTEGSRKPLKVIKLGHETCESSRDACCHRSWTEAGRSTPSP